MQPTRLFTVCTLLAAFLANGNAGGTTPSARHGSPRRPSADQRLREIYTAEWKWRSHDGDGDGDSEDDAGRIADHLPRVDDASQAQRLVHWQTTLAALKDVKRGDLSPAEQLNYDIYRPQIEILVRLQELRDYEMPVNSDSAFWTGLTYTARSTFKGTEDYRRWIRQMKDIPRYFAEEEAQMRAGLARGFTPPRVTLEGRDGSLSPVTDAPPEQTFFFLPFEKMNGVPAGDCETLRAEALEWSTTRGSRSGRVAWQYVQDLAGRLGVKLG